MIGMDSEHCQIVEKTLAGQREADEKTFASLEILSERLERLNKLGGLFSNIEFSSAVRELAGKKISVAVC